MKAIIDGKVIESEELIEYMMDAYANVVKNSKHMMLEDITAGNVVGYIGRKLKINDNEDWDFIAKSINIKEIVKIAQKGRQSYLETHNDK